MEKPFPIWQPAESLSIFHHFLPVGLTLRLPNRCSPELLDSAKWLATKGKGTETQDGAMGGGDCDFRWAGPRKDLDNKGQKRSVKQKGGSFVGDGAVSRKERTKRCLGMGVGAEPGSET